MGSILMGLLCLPFASLAAPDRVAPAEIPGTWGGGGGLQGGAWTHSVPLELPPAPAGLVPGISLVIDHRLPDGPLGPNWMLAGFSRIDRTNFTGGVPDFDDTPEYSTDLFVADGERLWEATTMVDLFTTSALDQWGLYYWAPEGGDG